jgi:hypothetical protein
MARWAVPGRAGTGAPRHGTQLSTRDRRVPHTSRSKSLHTTHSSVTSRRSVLQFSNRNIQLEPDLTHCKETTELRPYRSFSRVPGFSRVSNADPARVAPGDLRKPKDLSLLASATLLDTECRVKNDSSHRKQTKSDHSTRHSGTRLHECCRPPATAEFGPRRRTAALYANKGCATFASGRFPDQFPLNFPRKGRVLFVEHSELP